MSKPNYETYNSYSLAGQTYLRRIGLVTMDGFSSGGHNFRVVAVNANLSCGLLFGSVLLYLKQIFHSFWFKATELLHINMRMRL